MNRRRCRVLPPSSNTGSEAIVQLTSKFDQADKTREQFPLLEFEKSLKNKSFNEDGEIDFLAQHSNPFIVGALWHTPLIEEDLISFFVPFLPLERRHVRQCIERELQRILDEEIEQYRINTKAFVDEVLGHIEFVSTKSKKFTFEYARYGCKSVIQKTNTIFEMHRSDFVSSGRKDSHRKDL